LDKEGAALDSMRVKEPKAKLLAEKLTGAKANMAII
jgi:hypothetical protein